VVYLWRANAPNRIMARERTEVLIVCIYKRMELVPGARTQRILSWRENAPKFYSYVYISAWGLSLARERNESYHGAGTHRSLFVCIYKRIVLVPGTHTHCIMARDTPKCIMARIMARDAPKFIARTQSRLSLLSIDILSKLSTQAL
jgi:hypothetical protein